MAFDKDCPCTKECTRRPDCKGCERGNAYRQKKQAEAKQRYINNSFYRYEMNEIQNRLDRKAKRSKKKDRRWSNQK